MLLHNYFRGHVAMVPRPRHLPSRYSFYAVLLKLLVQPIEDIQRLLPST